MTESQGHQVTVIMPTLAEPARRESLLRAVDSILGQEGVKALPLLIINGQRFDLGLRESLEHRTDLTALYTPEAHVAKAQALGVEQVQTDYFAFLDDDDIYTRDALAHRLALLEREPASDVVVTNVQVERQGAMSLMSDDLERYATEPLHSVFELAWLNSANNLFRTATVGTEFFQDRDRFMEWTELAIRLARCKRIAFSNKPTAVYHETTSSASKQAPYLEAQLHLMTDMSRRTFPAKTRRLINRKRMATLNVLSQRAREEGRFGRAWRLHLQCLMVPGGWRYLGFTRKLANPARG